MPQGRQVESVNRSSVWGRVLDQLIGLFERPMGKFAGGKPLLLVGWEAEGSRLAAIIKLTWIRSSDPCGIAGLVDAAPQSPPWRAGNGGTEQVI